MDKEQVEIVGHLCTITTTSNRELNATKQVAYVIDAQGNVWMIDGPHMRKVEAVRI